MLQVFNYLIYSTLYILNTISSSSFATNPLKTSVKWCLFATNQRITYSLRIISNQLNYSVLTLFPSIPLQEKRCVPKVLNTSQKVIYFDGIFFGKFHFDLRSLSQLFSELYPFCISITCHLVFFEHPPFLIVKEQHSKLAGA